MKIFRTLVTDKTDGDCDLIDKRQLESRMKNLQRERSEDCCMSFRIRSSNEVRVACTITETAAY